MYRLLDQKYYYVYSNSNIYINNVYVKYKPSLHFIWCRFDLRIFRNDEAYLRILSLGARQNLGAHITVAQWRSEGMARMACAMGAILKEKKRKKKQYFSEKLHPKMMRLKIFTRLCRDTYIFVKQGGTKFFFAMSAISPHYDTAVVPWQAAQLT